MPMYAYKGIAASGKNISGVKDADSPKTLRQLLRKDGILVTSFELSRGGKAAKEANAKKGGLSRDVDLGGHQIPAGSTLMIYIRGIHRRGDYYPSPLAFKPDRMLPEAKKARPRQQYIPFGAGPRVCIGAHFALMEAQLCLATMIQRTKLRPLATHVMPEPLVTLRPRGGLPARVDVVRA